MKDIKFDCKRSENNIQEKIMDLHLDGLEKNDDLAGAQIHKVNLEIGENN